MSYRGERTMKSKRANAATKPRTDNGSKDQNIEQRWRLFVNHRRKYLVGAAIVGGLLMVGGAMSYFSTIGVPPRMDQTDPTQVKLGQRVYIEACASCHGATLGGQPNWQRKLANGRLPAPPHDVSGHTWHHADPVLFKITKYGPAAYPGGYDTDMPAFVDRLSDGEIAAVLAYIKSTWPLEIQARQARLNNSR